MRMHTLVMALAAALAATAAAKAEEASISSSKVDVSLYGGYTTLSMGDINNDLSLFSGPGVTVDKVSGGFYAGLGGEYKVMPMLNLGLRVEDVMGAGDVKVPGTKLAESATLIPVLIGASTQVAIVPTFLIKGGLYVGPGFGTNDMKFSGGATGDLDASGTTFMGELMLEAKYQFIPMLALGLNLGYRLADVNAMKVDSATGNFSGVPSGSLPKFGSAGDTSVDFSGLNVGLNLTGSF